MDTTVVLLWQNKARWVRVGKEPTIEQGTTWNTLIVCGWGHVTGKPSLTFALDGCCLLSAHDRVNYCVNQPRDSLELVCLHIVDVHLWSCLNEGRSRFRFSTSFTFRLTTSMMSANSRVVQMKHWTVEDPIAVVGLKEVWKRKRERHVENKAHYLLFWCAKATVNAGTNLSARWAYNFSISFG